MKNQTFGIEIETTGIGRERTAKAIAAYFGTTAQYRGRHLDDWRVPMPDGRHWTVESDGSVTDPNAEVVSPVCRYEDIGMVQEVVRAIRAAGAKADGSCGIHIHIGLGEHTPQRIRPWRCGPHVGPTSARRGQRREGGARRKKRRANCLTLSNPVALTCLRRTRRSVFCRLCRS